MYIHISDFVTNLISIAQVRMYWCGGTESLFIVYWQVMLSRLVICWVFC